MSNPAVQKFGEKNMEVIRRPAHPQENAGDHTGVLAAVSVFHEMQQFGLKPNVVTFSAILNACSRCASLQEASVLLEQMRFFDSWVYGIAHGLLMGLRDQVWVEALRLFDEIARMDYATGAAFYNALTDVLWHFGQVRTFPCTHPYRRQVVLSTDCVHALCLLSLHPMLYMFGGSLPISESLNVRKC